MKKIFYSMMAVALCACSQSDVDDVVTPPQPENNGLTFTVVDNGFVNEDGTRVSYGDYGSANDGAYKATFQEDDAIGLYAIKSGELIDHKYGGKYPQSEETSYTVKNVKLTLTDGVWKSETPINFGDADILFAYSPYRSGASVTDDYEPTFTGSTGAWAINTDNNRFFVGGNTYEITDNSGDNFKDNDWMGAVVNLKGGEQTITFSMQHMRGMVELTTHKDVTLEDLTLAIAGDKGTQYHFTPYHIETDDKHVYRILTTEYRSKNTLYATIQDLNITKKYKKSFSDNSVGAGKCVQVNIDYTPAETITVNDGVEGHNQSLADILTEKYGANYATAPTPALTSLRLAGTLSEADWTTLQSLTTLTTLDMYQLANTEIPSGWLVQRTNEQITDGATATTSETLTSLVLPNKLTTIKGNALQVGDQLTNIELPASVTTIEGGAFYWNPTLSIRIPENSSLTTIGNGAFYYTKAVYTYENNFNILVLPKTLTGIGKEGVFSYVGQLRKVIFRGPNLTIAENDDAFANTTAVINVPAGTRAAYEGKFPGKTVYAGPALTVDNYSSPYTHHGTWDNMGETALCDGIIGDGNNHWHSVYGSTYNFGEWGIYIDIELPEAHNNLMVSYTTRKDNINGAPTKVRMAVSNDGTTYTPVGSDYTGDALATTPNETKAFGPITASADYKYVRFAMLEVKGNSVENVTGSSVSANLSELTLYTDTWTDPAAAPAQ